MIESHIRKRQAHRYRELQRYDLQTREMLYLQKEAEETQGKARLEVEERIRKRSYKTNSFSTLR